MLTKLIMFQIKFRQLEERGSPESERMGTVKFHSPSATKPMHLAITRLTLPM